MERKSESSSLVMMASTFISRLLGILKSRALAVFFGAGALSDAINFAYNIPNNFRKLFAEGSLCQSYLPLFSSFTQDRERSSRLYSQLVSFLLLIFLLLFILSIFFSEFLIKLISGFSDEYRTGIAASLLPYFTLFLFFISLSTLVSTILQTRGRFIASSIAPIFFTLGILVSLPLLSGKLSYYSMAAGVIAGSAAQFLVVYYSFRKLSLRFRFDFSFSSPDFRCVLSHWLPSSISSIIAIVSQTITLYLASSLAEGSVTAFSNAVIFYQAPYGVFFASIAAVYSPQFSQAADEKERACLLCRSMGYLYTFLLPSALILLTLSRECVAVVLQKGAFTLEDTYLTAGVLNYYLIAMLPLSFYSILQRYMFSINRYYTNLIVSALVTITDLVLTLFFIRCGYGVSSLAISYIFSSLAGALMLFAFVREFEYGKLFRQLLRLTLINLPLIILCVGYKIWSPSFYETGSTLANFIRTCLSGLSLAAATVIMYVICRVDFLSQLRRKRS